jgi:hypothetical protein
VCWKRRAQGGALAFIGFMLSPLSWWNDLFVNVPLAVGFGWLVSLAWKPAFEYAVLAGYWLTNVLGFVLLHKGVERAAGETPAPFLSRRGLGKDLLVSLLYTLLILTLVKLKVLQPIGDYFSEGTKP